MAKRKRKPYTPRYYMSNVPNVNVQNFYNFSLNMIYSNACLNIFSDASTRRTSKYGDESNKISDYCYGAIAVCKDDFIDELFRLQSGVTTPAAEIRGIRLSLRLALKHRYEFHTINIFSDSLLNITVLRNHLSSYLYCNDDGLFYTDAYYNKPIANQELFVECILLLNELRKTNIINFFYQPGHVDNGLANLQKAIEKFKRGNKIPGKIDYNLIRYISIYNNFVDNKSRSYVNRSNVIDKTYRDSLIFYPRAMY